MMYPKKLASTPVNIINGPATAVNPPKNVKACFNGLGNILKKLITLSITPITIVPIFKNCSPT